LSTPDRRRPRRACLLSPRPALAAVVFALAACGGGTSHTTASVTQPRGSFPVTVTPANGPVTIPARPRRIVSVSPAATQMLYAIGAGSQVVAVDQYSTVPANAPRTKLDPESSSAEDYQTYRPDLVITAFDTGDQLSHQLQALKIPTLVLPAATSLADTWSQFRLIGRATGHAANAQAEVSRLQAQLRQAAAAASPSTRNKTYYVEFSSNLYTATSKTFIGSLFSLLGMKNVADAADKTGSGYPQLSAEYLLAANPDYVVLADDQCCGQSVATFSARPGFSTLRAVKDHHVLVVPDSVASQWGPNVVTFLQDIVRGVRDGSAGT
jgi:iron complex transport system substrate-binding protein